MSTTNPKVSLHMVSSLDGFIAKKDGDLSWLHSSDRYEKGISLSEADIEAYLSKIDCYVMGSHTYEHALELGWPYGDHPVIVLTNRSLHSDKESVQFYAGDLPQLIEKNLYPKYKNIWVVGGSMLAKDFLRLNLIDEIILSIMPIILGNGLLFFDFIGKEIPLHLKDIMAFKDGMVELCYEVRKA